MTLSITRLDDTVRGAALARLAAIVQEKSFQIGPEMTLASGQTSTVYFNMKPTMLDAEGALLIAMLILDLIDDVKVDFIGGLEMGAVPIASATAAVSQARGLPISAFFIRKQAKEHGTRSLIEGLAPGITLAGKQLVVVEDVTTTGGSALKAVEAIRAEGGTVLAVITILDRQEGAEDAFATAGLAFRSLLTKGDFLVAEEAAPPPLTA